MSTRVSRRQLALAALAPALPAAESGYKSALDNLESKVDLDTFDPVIYSRKRYDQMPLRLTFPGAKNAKQVEAWQKRLREKLFELVGPFPSPRDLLKPQTLEVRDFPNYRREKFVVETRPGVGLLGYLLTPKSGKGTANP